MDVLIEEVVKLLGGVLAGALIALVLKLSKKAGLSIDSEREAQIRQAAVDAVSRVEEWAATQIKAKKKNITGGVKLERAIADVIDRVPGVTYEEAEQVIQAALPQMGLGAAAGARQLVKAIRTR